MCSRGTLSRFSLSVSILLVFQVGSCSRQMSATAQKTGVRTQHASTKKWTGKHGQALTGDVQCNSQDENDTGQECKACDRVPCADLVSTFLTLTSRRPPSNIEWVLRRNGASQSCQNLVYGEQGFERHSESELSSLATNQRTSGRNGPVITSVKLGPREEGDENLNSSPTRHGQRRCRG